MVQKLLGVFLELFFFNFWHHRFIYFIKILCNPWNITQYFQKSEFKMDNIDSVFYIDIICNTWGSLYTVHYSAGFHHGHPELLVTELQCFFPPSFQPKCPRYSEAHTVKSRRKMNCPQVSQSNGTISYYVGEYFLITERSLQWIHCLNTLWLLVL